MAFQERTDSTKLCQMHHEMTKTNRWSLVAEEEEPLPIFEINPKCNPSIILGPKAVGNENVFNITDEKRRWRE